MAAAVRRGNDEKAFGRSSFFFLGSRRRPLRAAAQFEKKQINKSKNNTNMSKKTRKTETIVIRLEPQLLEYVEKIADSHLKKSAVVRNMIYEFFLCIPPEVAKQVVWGYKKLSV